MTLTSIAVASVLQGCVICWSPALEPHSYFHTNDLVVLDPRPAWERPALPERRPPAARPAPRRTITIPGYVPPLRVPQWLHPDPRL